MHAHRAARIISQTTKLTRSSASLRSVLPNGVYVTIVQGNPTLWEGVLFVRKGPYAPAILRFQISFPPEFPSMPPLITFSSDIFHPLLTPLTTYTYTTGSSTSETVSASDEERLPPGGFSLRHGFPQWFGRARRSDQGSREASGSQASQQEPSDPDERALASPPLSTDGKAHSAQSKDPLSIRIVEVLRYIRSTFTNETVLDSIPLETAANPGAYHAWRTHRAHALQHSTSPNKGPSERSHGESPTVRARRPGEWNWEGVWEERVRKGIHASTSEAVLYGTFGGDDIIRFSDIDTATLDKIRTELVTQDITATT
ncbi:ubiquitin-conjugating enzyme/RWD-like protein [Lineolata rhizophorae]|uniref:Ubiquitin-conjugating enzyme/RWD-like protein n=1 Tax=Lineolata rhizophorae TaxID=578093 RepID=A0A6A6P3H6_9PEZI|nr:ubiquitin-conjugating enzyme/RWD-like protein [Lineolata rhizophorae]